MNKLLAVGVVSILLAGCTSVEEREDETAAKNFEGTYQELYVPQFAEVVNSGTWRNAQRNVFVQYDRGSRAIEVYPGSVYEPDMPASLKKGYTAEVTLEQVNRHAEQAKEIVSFTTTSLKEAYVDIPDEPGQLYRYTVKVRDADNVVKDIRYDPLFTTFKDYNMSMRLMKDVYAKDETITFVLENWGPNHLSYSEAWEVLRKQGNEWVKVTRHKDSGTIGFPEPIKTAWTMSYLEVDRDAGLLMPQETASFMLDRYDWEEGEYKLKVRVGSAKHPYTLEDTFRVE